MTSTSIVGLQPREAVVSGSIRFDGRDLVAMSSAQLTEVRGRDIGFIFRILPRRSIP